MQAMRIVRTLERTQLYELTPYLGKKVEIIVFPIEEEMSDNTQRLASMLEIVDECAGHLATWTREELYDRKILS